MMRTKDEREKREREKAHSCLCEGGWRLVVVVARLYTLSFLSLFLSSKSSSSSSLFWKKFPLFLFSAREREIDVCVFGMDGDEIFETLSTSQKRRRGVLVGLFFRRIEEEEKEQQQQQKSKQHM